ncbi:L,D-transpeptidase family protein [Trichloromonas sp.]|uniref:L,D-transpeptidase family protein n=1 Tax=Trichloromonas sp. TaxID=3069249 RepID=UPI002A374532|nr:L,D-transpeptidase family protein [Trichloromonas sp.]
MRKPIRTLTIAALLLIAVGAHGKTPEPLTPHTLSSQWRGEIIGEHRYHTVADSRQTLMELARDLRLGFVNVKNANPDIDPWLPTPGQNVLLPYASILPVDAMPGITINLAEMRLYHVWKKGGYLLARVYPLGIGSEGNDSPTGHFSILNKAENPTWTVPVSIRHERPGMPISVPPGPANPLGKYWMSFSTVGYGIHGTNKPLGVGRRVSHGCIRLYPQDIQELFHRVPVGTGVLIIDTPVKVGRKDNTLFLEVHLPNAQRQDFTPLKKEVVRQARLLEWAGLLNWDVIDEILRQNRGIPQPISVTGPTATASR